MALGFRQRIAEQRASETHQRQDGNNAAVAKQRYQATDGSDHQQQHAD